MSDFSTNAPNPAIQDGESNENAILPVTSKPARLTETEAYYHSLYHLVTHWAAYVAMTGVLLTIGILLCLTPIPDIIPYRDVRFFSLILIVLLSGTAAFTFINRMKLYGDYVNLKLPYPYKDRLKEAFDDPSRPIWRGRIVAFVLTLLDIVLLILFW